MAIGGIGLSVAAGMLSILSPCVLPILPIVLGAAAAAHRFGPAALAAGLAASVVVVGLFAATLGFSIGLDGDVFRGVAAVLMVAIGAVLLLPRVAASLAPAGGPVANWADARFEGHYFNSHLDLPQTVFPASAFSGAATPRPGPATPSRGRSRRSTPKQTPKM